MKHELSLRYIFFCPMANLNIIFFPRRLNWRLIQSTEHIVDYVICHELSHLKFMNHSQQFWSLVSEIFPDFKQTQTQLKLIGFQLYQLD